MQNWMVIGGVVVGVLVVIPLIVSTFLRDVAAGEIRLSARELVRLDELSRPR